MSSEGGTSAGGVTGDVTGSELAKVSQQSHVSVWDITDEGYGASRLIGQHHHSLHQVSPF